MEFVETLEHVKARVEILGKENVAVVYSYTSTKDGKTHYVIFIFMETATKWKNRIQLDVQVVWTPEEGWIDEG